MRPAVVARFLAVVLLLAATVVQAGESITLTAPQQVNAYTPRDLFIHYEPPSSSMYRVVFVGNLSNEQIIYEVNDTVANGNLATARIKALNKVDLSANSLLRRMIQQAISDGKLPAGSITGAPD